MTLRPAPLADRPLVHLAPHGICARASERTSPRSIVSTDAVDALERLCIGAVLPDSPLSDETPTLPWLPVVADREKTTGRREGGKT